MIDKEEQQLIIDASVLYYLEGKTQSQIAKELYLSRPKVSRLLKKARELQIVDITINYQNDEFEQLQGEIRRAFGIPHVVISKTLSSTDDTSDEVGKAAAKEVASHLRDDMTLGISWGQHVRRAAKFMNRKHYNDLRIVELFGAVSYDLGDADMLSIGRSLSSKLDSKLYPLPSPIYINDDVARRAIMETPLIQSTLNMIKNCDLIITGIGSIDSKSMQTLWDNYVDSEMKNRVIKAGGIGFLMAHFFDRDGRFLDIDINDHIIGIDTETIKDKKILAIASGDEKVRAIYAALSGKLLDTIVSDEETLRKVLNHYKQVHSLTGG